MKTSRLALALLLTNLSTGVFAAPAELSPRQIYQHSAPAVVLLMCVSNDGTGELGTGSVIDASGKILTNAHVAIRASTRQPYERIHVYFKPARVTGDQKLDLVKPYEAHVLSFDRALDLAVLQLDEKPEDLSVLPIGDADTVEAGEPVVAIGHPEQGGLWTLTTGVVSTVLADLGGVKGKHAFQTDASINRGNSGGPLINRGGAMIGVNTSMARKAADGLTITSVNFSVKSSVVKTWLAGSGVKADYLEAAPVIAAAEPKTEPKVEAPPKAAAKENIETTVAQVKPEPKVEKPAEPAPKAKPQISAPVAQAPAILTPKKPFKISDLIAKEIAEMEDMEKEMADEVEKRRGSLNSMGGKQ